jgi:hypothetical protein
MRPPAHQHLSRRETSFMLQRRLMWVVWPAFLAAGLMEAVVFAMVDPQELQWAGQPLSWSREAVYTLAFFIFWCIAVASNSLTALLSMSPQETNR